MTATIDTLDILAYALITIALIALGIWLHDLISTGLDGPEKPKGWDDDGRDL